MRALFTCRRYPTYGVDICIGSCLYSNEESEHGVLEDGLPYRYFYKNTSIRCRPSIFSESQFCCRMRAHAVWLLVVKVSQRSGKPVSQDPLPGLWVTNSALLTERVVFQTGRHQVRACRSGMTKMGHFWPLSHTGCCFNCPIAGQLAQICLCYAERTFKNAAI